MKKNFVTFIFIILVIMNQHTGQHLVRLPADERGESAPSQPSHRLQPVPVQPAGDPHSGDPGAHLSRPVPSTSTDADRADGCLHTTHDDDAGSDYSDYLDHDDSILDHEAQNHHFDVIGSNGGAAAPDGQHAHVRLLDANNQGALGAVAGDHEHAQNNENAPGNMVEQDEWEVDDWNDDLREGWDWIPLGVV
jgi:hypothetical protein